MTKSNRQRVFCVMLIITVPVFTIDGPATVATQTGKQAPTGDLQLQQAVLALDKLVADARDYDNCLLRGRVRLQAADLLWQLAPEKALELAELAFQDSKSKDLKEQERYSLRSELLGVVRKNDRKLLATFIKRVSESETESRAPMSRQSTEHITSSGALYLDLANEMWREGDKQRATDMARRSLSEGRSPKFLHFLNELAKHDESIANNLFLDSLRLVLRESTDPNDVLYLGLYLFSPGTISFTDNNGQLIIGHGINFGALRPPDSLLQPYLIAAAAVLQRALMPGRDLGNQLDAARFALQQLTPLFEEHLPQQAVELRSRLVQLGHVVLASNTSSDVALPVLSEGLSVSEISKRIERIPGTRVRDCLYFDAAIAALKRGDPDKSEAFRSSIAEVGLKQELLQLIALSSARKAIERGDLDEAEWIASKLSPLGKALVYQKLASAWLKRQYVGRGIEMILSGSQMAQKMEQKAHGASVNIALASLVVSRDPVRAFELLESAAKGINSTDEFDARRDNVSLVIHKPNGSKFEQGFSLGATLVSVMSQLASADFGRCMEFARSLKADAPRSASIIAACKAVLSTNRGPRSVETGANSNSTAH